MVSLVSVAIPMSALVLLSVCSNSENFERRPKAFVNRILRHEMRVNVAGWGGGGGGGGGVWELRVRSIRGHWLSCREARIDCYLGLPFLEFAASLGSGKFQGRV